MLRRQVYLWGTITIAVLAVTGCSFRDSVPVAGSFSSAQTSTMASSQSKGEDTGLQTTAKTGKNASGMFAGMGQVINPHLKLFNNHSGFAWGYSQNKFKVYHTSNMGSTWQEIQIPLLPENQASNVAPSGFGYVTANFLDETHGQVVWLSSGQAHILCTTDGGTSWQETTIPVPSDGVRIGQLSFSTTNTGWLLVLGDGSSGVSSKYLYHTSDGGLTWTLVNTSMNALPHNGTDMAMAFSTDGKHGVVTTLDPFTSSLFLETTADAGVHWATPTVTLPSDTRAISIIPSSTLSTFNGMNACITAIVQTDANSQLIVFHQNAKGGWQSFSTVVGTVKGVGWSSPQTGMMIEEQNGKETLLRTLDGGVTWTADGSVPVGLTDPAAAVTEFEMVNLSTGWLVLQDDQLQPSLLITTDGGNHWARS